MMRAITLNPYVEKIIWKSTITSPLEAVGALSSLSSRTIANERSSDKSNETKNCAFHQGLAAYQVEGTLQVVLRSGRVW